MQSDYCKSTSEKKCKARPFLPISDHEPSPAQTTKKNIQMPFHCKTLFIFNILVDQIF